MKYHFNHPLAITMWDFSWLERRWPGAGYEDWEMVLDQLVERGYDAVRIDAYPHLIAADGEKEWLLLPEWNQQVWGSPTNIKVVVQPNLIRFLTLCRERNLKVGLSTWFREDKDNIRMNIKTPEDHGRIWKITLDLIQQAGLLDSILYVDLCNEFSLSVWAPFLGKIYGKEEVLRATPEGTNWMKESVSYVQKFYPQLDYCFSMCSEYDTLDQQDVSFLDLLEPHVWMAQCSDFYLFVGYNYERFDSIGYENLVERGEKLYRINPDYWKASLKAGIEKISRWSETTGKPLITTECWGVVDYKDWPGLNWDWVKELCEFGVMEASKTGRWVAMATSNFCGPQFAGMWRDVAWHKKLTDVIHRGLIIYPH